MPKEGYVGPRLKSLLHKFFDHHHDLVDRYEISLGTFTFYVDIFLPLSLSRLLYMNNTMGVLLEAGNDYGSRAHGFNPGFW